MAITVNLQRHATTYGIGGFTDTQQQSAVSWNVLKYELKSHNVDNATIIEVIIDMAITTVEFERHAATYGIGGFEDT